MNRIIASVLVLSGMTANAQVKDGMVGINTSEPRATLHIEPGVSESKGLIIPRITAAQMKTMTSLAHFGADHHAIITYLKEQLPATDRTGKLADVADPGYYFYNHTEAKWKVFGGGGAEQNFKILSSSVTGVPRYNYLTKNAGIGGNGTSLGTGVNNIAIGQDALYSNTTGYDNIAQGQEALKSNTTGYDNIAQGREALRYNTTGGDNIAQGSATLRYNTTGESNIAQGSAALESNTTGYNNIAQGWGALYSNTTADNNIAMGKEALRYNTTGHDNIAQGNEALRYNTTGFGNIAMGLSSGKWIKGNGNIHIGMDTTTIIPDAIGELNNVVAIGHFNNEGFHPLNTTTADNNVILLGDARSIAPKVGVGTYKPQAKLDVAGAVRVANDTSACTSANEGAIRYVSASKKFQGCDGSNWINLH